MATPVRTAADYMAETEAKIAGSLKKEQMDSLGGALGRVVSGQYTLRGERAKRGTKISDAIAAYERALNSGSTAAQIRASADMFRLQRELPVKFASAAYTPNDALLNAVSASIPLLLKDIDPKSKQGEQAAQIAWQTFFLDSRATDGNLLGSWREMVTRYGEPQAAYYGASNPAVANAANNFFNKKKVAEQNAKLFEENMNSLSAVGEPYEAFVERTGMPAESDDTVRAFLQSYPDLQARLPKANAPFIDQLRGMVQDPEKSKAFFSDIDASLAAAGEQEEKYLGLMGLGEGAATDRAQTDREKLAGWIQRPDVQEWAKKWGLNLGTVREVTPEIQKLIDEGQISKDDLVNGRLYTSSPDDVRAVNLAFRQMERNPQKNIFYQMGLTRQAGPRTVMEIEEIVQPIGARPLGVEARTITGADGKDARIVKLDDGTYAIGPAQKGASYTKLSSIDGAKLFDAAPPGQKFDTPVKLPGIEGAPVTRTRRIQSLGPEYGRDMPGSERGIDLDTGKLVVIPPEKIASKEVTHGGVAKKSLGDVLLERRAATTRRKEGIGLTEEDINAMDIGKEATKGQIRESAETTAEIAKGLPAVPASYMREDLTGRARGPLTEAEIAQQDERTRASMAGVSPVEQVPVEEFRSRRLSKTPEERAAESAAESAMFDAALAGKAAPAQTEAAMFEKALGQSAAKTKKMPLPVVSPAPGVVAGGLPGPAPERRSAPDKAKVGTTTGAETETTKPLSFGEEIGAAMREEREVPALPEPPDMKKKYADATRQAYAAATARARAEQAAAQRPGRPPPVSPPLP
jgi:hypothetical protein